MKIAIITDTHFGATSEPFAFLDHQKVFYDEVFFPTLEKHKIETIVHLGDLVDRRTFIDIKILKRMREEFLDLLKNKDFHIIAGNHDVYNKNTNSINALDELLSSYNFKIYTQTQEVKLGNKKILFVPWINKENGEHSLEQINSTSCDVCFGHLEIEGFEMTKGRLAEHGFDPSIFKHFSKVFSGHFHKRSSKKNIYYLGSPFQMTWDDYGDVRGFHLFDTETYDLEFIENPTPLYVKYFYNDEKKSEKELLEDLKKVSLSKSYCKVIVESKLNPNFMDNICNTIEKNNPLKLDIVPAQQLFSSTASDHIDTIEDTISLIKNVVNSTSFSDKKKLEKLMIDLYNEAQTVGEE